MKAENVTINPYSRVVLHFSSEVIDALALEGKKITKIIITHTLEPQANESSVKIEYHVEHPDGDVSLDYKGVLDLAFRIIKESAVTPPPLS